MGLLVHHVSLIFILLVKASQAQRVDVDALSPPPKTGICGKPNPTFNSKPERTITPRFGRPDDVASAGTWPWMVSLQRNGQFLCGGTLVAEEFVLTDRDCFEGFPTFNGQFQVNVKELTATLGRFVQNGVNPNEVTLNVTAIRFSNQALTNAALLKVVKTTMNDFIQPVCLDLTGRFLPVGMRCFALAWATPGGVMTGGAPSILKEFRPFVHDTCNGFNIQPDDVCMTGINVKGAKGGGPVVCKIDDSWIQVAILTLKYVSTAVDAKTGDSGSAGVFRPPVANDVVAPPGGFVGGGGPPHMLLQKTSRFRAFLVALTQSFPEAAPGPTTRMPRVVVTNPTVTVIPLVAVSNANGIHLSLLPALFFFVQLVLSVMQWF